MCYDLPRRNLMEFEKDRDRVWKFFRRGRTWAIRRFWKTQEKEWNPEEVELKSEKDQIKFEDFDKVEIRVAEVKEVEKVEGSDKLLRFRLDTGDGEDRQILSGIAKFYPNEQELVGKKLQVVANLKPRKMMKKYVSQGMILSAEHDGKLTDLTVDPSVPNGSVIG